MFSENEGIAAAQLGCLKRGFAHQEHVVAAQAFHVPHLEAFSTSSVNGHARAMLL